MRSPIYQQPSHNEKVGHPPNMQSIKVEVKLISLKLLGAYKVRLSQSCLYLIRLDLCMYNLVGSP